MFGAADDAGIIPRALHELFAYTPTPYTLHPTPCTLHPAPYTLHPTPYTLHPTPYTLHLTPYTLHPTPYTLNSEPETGAAVPAWDHPACSLRTLETRNPRRCLGSRFQVMRLYATVVQGGNARRAQADLGDKKRSRDTRNPHS